ncbi:MAG: ThiF family adenylyltransferase [Deltaproteobacteria bacterium]|nr:ThiF family adenylyltransferase [Deltaproteobacteria bacterium]
MSGKSQMESYIQEWKSRFERQRKFLPKGLYEIIGRSAVYLDGVGAFGGPAALILAKTGVQKFLISDSQSYHVDSIVGQLLANVDSVGHSKTEIAKEIILKINPEAEVEIVPSSNRIEVLRSSIDRVDAVVMGMDTFSEGIACYRAARECQKPVVDFFFFPTPNVSSTFPEDPMPEERFDYPTQSLAPEDCDQAEVGKESMARLLAYGFSTLPEIYEECQDLIPDLLPCLLKLELPIPTFAPMTAQIGVLLAREAIACIAQTHRIKFPRLGWPAFYLDMICANSRVPISPFLKESPNWETWYQRMLEMQK